MKNFLLLSAFSLFLSGILIAQPVNDNLCNATALTLGEDCSTTFQFDNLGASAEIGEPLPACFADGTIEASVWFSFVAPPSGAVTITTDFAGSGMQDSQLAVYELPTGDCSDLFTLDEIACNEDVIPTALNTDFNAGLPPIPVNPGQIYFIQVDGYYDGYFLSEGDFCLMVYDSNPPLNDDCASAEIYGGFGPECTKIFNGTTIGATAGNGLDILTCDASEFNASVYYVISVGVPEVEFNLLTGENINVALFTNPDLNSCDGSAVEITGNCFTNIDTSDEVDPMDPNVLFTNLTPMTQYLLAIWTDEGEATDFSFCLTRASAYACGDGDCYVLAESYTDCPDDCPCFSDIEFFNYATGNDSFLPVGVCPEIVGGETDSNNPGLYIPFTIDSDDFDFDGSLVSSTAGIFYTSTTPPSPLSNDEATNFLIYLFLTESEIAAGGDVTIYFQSDYGACTAEVTFSITDLMANSPATSDCGGCDLVVTADYSGTFCDGNGNLPTPVSVENAVGPIVWIGLDGNTTYDPEEDFFTLSLTQPTVVPFGNSDGTFIIYDSGRPNCATRFTIYTGDFDCFPSPECVVEDSISTICRLNPIVSNVTPTCNDDGTISIPIDIGRPTGTVVFDPDVVSGSGTDTDPYTVSVDPVNCQTLDINVSDDSTCGVTPIVTINSPGSIAGGIEVGTNSDFWGIQIPQELGVCGTDTSVVGILAVVNDEDTAGGQLTDFCEPDPTDPTAPLPAASVCDPIAGKIVMIDRGQCNFTSKIENAEACGAIGVIICNCQVGPSWCAATADALMDMGAAANYMGNIGIPAVFMLYSDCEEIKAEINNGIDVEVCIGAPETVVGCERDFTLDVCNDISTIACDDGDCSTENDVATLYAGNGEICACAGIAIQCAAGETFNDNTCMCEPDNPTVCTSTINSLAAPSQSFICNDGSNLPAFVAPVSSLPDVEIIVEINGVLTGISNDGNFDASVLNIDDEVCFTAFAYDLAAIQNTMSTLGTLCSVIDLEVLLPGLTICDALADLINGPDESLLNNLQEIFDLLIAFSYSIDSVESAIDAINDLNLGIVPLNIDEICYAASSSICLPVNDCNGTCEEEISGSIVVDDPGCDVSGIDIMIMAPDGTSISVVTDVNGNFTVPGGPFPCGTYSATIVSTDLPACYSDTGEIGPIQFVVDGQGSGDDGPFFYANPTIPTLSQWGLITLALLLMAFGAIKLGFNTGVFKKKNFAGIAT